MIRIIGAAVFAIAASACATTQPEKMASAAPQNKGMITVVGLAPSQALGAVDTSKLVGVQAQRVTSNQPADTRAAATTTGNTIDVEGVAPAAVLAAIDTTKLVDNPTPQATASGLPSEVQAEVTDGKYTTKDLAAAQNKAVRDPG
ncbi:MAG: hypothetical protein QM773_15820 [Hyphomonadaceae bacterium]